MYGLPSRARAELGDRVADIDARIAWCTGVGLQRAS